MNNKLLFLSLLMAVVLVAAPAMATNGYDSHATGVKDMGLSGAGVAHPMGVLSTANNPATLALLGKEFSFGLAYFNPERSYTVTGNPSGAPAFGLTPGTVKSGSEKFIIPAFGGSRVINENQNFAWLVYGRGGMNTDYNANTFFGGTPTGVDLSQMFVTPTWSFKYNKKNYFAVTPILAYQKFKAEGLASFAPFSSAATKLSNNGYDSSFGYGLKLGYLSHVTPKLNFGLTYQSRIFMSKLDKYAGLFAEQGDFDIPQSITAGFAYQTSPKVTLMLDWQKIFYSDVKAISNKMMPLTPGSLGTSAGPGFGWEDVTVVKLGAEWKRSNSLTWRFGYSQCNQPIPNTEHMFNILAPSTVEKHVSVGFTKKLKNKREFNFAITRALENEITGINPLDPAQKISLKMGQWEAAFGYTWKY